RCFACGSRAATEAAPTASDHSVVSYAGLRRGGSNGAVVRARPVLGGLAAAIVCAAALTGTAVGASRDVGSDVSANWAGYVLTGASTSYTSVTGTWKPPRITCGASDSGSSSAFWVGLGGYYTSSQSLEQIGTSADCSATTGKPTYYAWYELVPDASVTITSFPVSPGDVITTSVNIVNGGSS